MNAFRFVVVSPKVTLQAFSPEGAIYASPGQRPGTWFCTAVVSPEGAICASPGQRPGAWFCNVVVSPERAIYASLGQRPGVSIHPITQALKGRRKPCRNRLHVSTFIWSSAPRTGNDSSRTRSGFHYTPIWLPCCKTLDAPRSLSIPSKIMHICSSTFPERCPSVKRSRMSRNRHPNGSRRRVRHFDFLPGNPAMVRSPFPNPILKPFGPISPNNRNIIADEPFRKSSGSFSTDTVLPSTSGMSGIRQRFRSPFQGSHALRPSIPRALPWAVIVRPVGAEGNAA